MPPLAEASEAASWISAGATALLGGLTLCITCFQFWANGFRVKARAEVEPAREALRVRLANRGRASGVITRVVVTDQRGVEHPGYEFRGFEGGRFVPRELPGRSGMELVIHTGARKFTNKDQARVDWGTTTKIVAVTPVDVGLWGLDSVLPKE
jgi:hypothetical protein